jgi:hypothetical protein
MTDWRRLLVTYVKVRCFKALNAEKELDALRQLADLEGDYKDAYARLFSINTESSEE